MIPPWAGNSPTTSHTRECMTSFSKEQKRKIKVFCKNTHIERFMKKIRESKCNSAGA